MTAGANRNPLSLRKRVLFSVITGIIVIVVIGVVAEAFTRMKGFTPLISTPLIISIEPPGSYFTAHPTRGWSHLPGEFKLTIAGPYSFRVTHANNGLRITHPLDVKTEANKPEIWLFGCSFTHGWRLNDEETYPWLLQQNLKDYEVVNFGVDGYGSVQSLIQFQESLKARKKPVIVVFAYAWFQDPRNVLTRSWKKALFINNRLGAVNYPYGSLDTDNNLVLHNEPLEYLGFPLLRHSALANLLDEKYDASLEGSYRQHEVSQAVVAEFWNLCKSNGIQFVLAGVYPDPLATEMLHDFNAKGALTVDISVDMTLPENANMPYDAHPSAKADKQFAQKLEAFLRASLMDKTRKP